MAAGLLRIAEMIGMIGVAANLAKEDIDGATAAQRKYNDERGGNGNSSMDQAAGGGPSTMGASDGGGTGAAGVTDGGRIATAMVSELQRRMRR